MADSGPALVIDIGGTKLAAAVAESGGRLIVWEKTPTPRDLDAEQLRGSRREVGRGVRDHRHRWRALAHARHRRTLDHDVDELRRPDDDSADSTPVNGLHDRGRSER